MASLKEKAKLREKSKQKQSQMGPGVVPLVQRYVVKEGVSRQIAIQTLEQRGKIKKVNGTYQLAK